MCATQFSTSYRPPAGPLSKEKMLNEECNFLHGNEKSDEQSLPPEDRMLRHDTSALCLSGGGIRSATFCLGAIQALAKAGLLKQFTYLSTVSGGGYIGSWLSRWRHQAGGMAGIESELSQNSNQSQEPPQVKQLRAYSNYLSPHWGLSSDLFSLISLVLRNLLLNWCVLLPAIGAFVLLPYVYISLLPSSAINIKTTFATTPILILSTSLSILIGLIGGIGHILADIPEKSNSKNSIRNRTKDAFTRDYFMPVFLACIMLSLLLPWLWNPIEWESFETLTGINFAHLPSWKLNQIEWKKQPWANFAIVGVIVLFLGRVYGNWLQKKSNATIQSGPLDWLSSIITGTLGGLWLCQLSQWLQSLEISRQLPSDTTPYIYTLPHVDRLAYATLAVPALLTSIWIATTALVAIQRKSSSESRREWWARSGGWWIKTSLLWILCFCLIIQAPKWILGLDYVQKFFNSSWILSSGITGGSLLGLLISIAGYWTKNGPIISNQARNLSNLIGTRLLEIFALAFIALMLLCISFWWTWLLDDNRTLPASEKWPEMVMQTAWPWSLVALALLILIAVVSSDRIGVNTFSLHSMYGNRLARAYLGAARAGEKRHPHWFTGFDDEDNVKMADLRADISQKRSPLHVLNLTLNIATPSNDHLEWQQRKAAAFTVTPLHSGSEVTNYQRSEEYAGGMSLARAMAISGAAASPNMGYHSSPAVAFVMTLFNVRLGWWLPNPGLPGKAHWKNNEPDNSLQIHLSEALGISKSNTPFAYLSDGGHFENLGLYEMVRRRCRHIMLLDVSADPDYCHQDLQDAVRKIRTDFGISIDFPTDSFDSPRPWIMGTIHYTDSAGNPFNGSLCYIKPALFGNEPLDVQRYAKSSQKRDGKNAFPHQSTSDQFFDEEQFESYRMLGHHMISQVFPNQSGTGKLKEIWRATSASTSKEAKTPNNDSPSSNKTKPSTPKEENSSHSNLANNIQNITKGAKLATAITVGSALGAGGTMAIKNTEISINKKNLDQLEEIINKTKPPPTNNLRAEVNEIRKEIQSIQEKLTSENNKIDTANEKSTKLENLLTTHTTNNHQHQSEIKEIEVKILLIQKEIESIKIKPDCMNDPYNEACQLNEIKKTLGSITHQQNPPKETTPKDILKTLHDIDSKLEGIEKHLNPRRNVRGIGGVTP